MKRLLILAAALVSLQASAADCYITEYADVIRTESGQVMPVSAAIVATQRVTYTTTTQSAAFNERTIYIRLVCDSAAHFTFGTNPSADADDPYIPANAPEYFGVPSGYEIAVYDGSS